jgi:hypothetical protein
VVSPGFIHTSSSRKYLFSKTFLCRGSLLTCTCAVKADEQNSIAAAMSVILFLIYFLLKIKSQLGWFLEPSARVIL